MLKMCHVCDKIVQNDIKFNVHIQSHTLYVCPKCYQIMPFNYGNYRHKSTCGLRNQEADVRIYQCTFCNFKSPNRNYFMKHQQLHNDGLLNQKCDSCQKSFKSEKKLSYHIAKFVEGSSRPVKANFHI